MYTAVIVEPRKHPAMALVLQNFLTNLDKRWKFIIFHGSNNGNWLMNLLDSMFSDELYRIDIKQINMSTMTSNEYSKLLTSEAFVKEIPTEIFLIFQTDTLICPGQKNLIYNFIHYDYVGAPWNEKSGRLCGYVGNGGLSLRKKSKMLEIIEKIPYPDMLPEDIYFCGIDHNIKVYKPTWQEASMFAIESNYAPKTFGLHSTWKWLPGINLEPQFPGYNELVRLNTEFY